MPSSTEGGKILIVLSHREGEERGSGSEGHFEAAFASRELAEQYIAGANPLLDLYIEEHWLHA